MTPVQSSKGRFEALVTASIVNINKNTMARARSARKTWTCAQNNNDVKQGDQSNNNGIAKARRGFQASPQPLCSSKIAWLVDSFRLRPRANKKPGAVHRAAFPVIVENTLFYLNSVS